jgi:hypothetical protein
VNGIADEQRRFFGRAPGPIGSIDHRLGATSGEARHDKWLGFDPRIDDATKVRDVDVRMSNPSHYVAEASRVSVRHR